VRVGFPPKLHSLIRIPQPLTRIFQNSGRRPKIFRKRLVFDDLGTVNACSGIVKCRDGIPAVGHRKEAACGAQDSTPGGWDCVHVQGSGGVLPGKLREKSQQHSWQRMSATLGQMWSSFDRKITFPLSKMMISRFRQRVQGNLDRFLR
jgi:hypothetical protein